MRTMIIREYGEDTLPVAYTLNLSQTQVKDCTGCWTCWWKTPGRCMHKDLDEFYRQYLAADRVVLFSSISKGFVSGNLKSLFDRLLPLFLPYTNFFTGESMHDPRYDRYPDIEVYYQGSFANKVEQKNYEDYLHRTFYQFHSKSTVVKPFEDWKEASA